MSCLCPPTSADTPSTASSLTPSTPSHDDSPERQNLFIPTSFIPSSIPSPRKRLSTLLPSIPDPTIHTASSSTAPFTTALPPVVQPARFTQPAQTIIPAIMSSAPFKMPLRGTDAAPKFNGTPTRLIPFCEDVELLADYAGLTAEQCIKAAIQYAPVDKSETWASRPTAKGKDWDKFVDAIKAMYPGCEGNHRYACTDLENLCREQVRKPIHSKKELGQFYCKFFHVSQYLLDKSRIAELELGRYF
ncbi:hypothetical protein DFJ58DRAFT_727615 [Suillus subalutaceus]|uniref:uncharacterized protein n=1 Tax=Suillus subalutaceus TaxID=48586 RepID=UPI001B85B3C5|nr:uncharacterized protein DFJ58DRAFT_727615 [Suillus subalutaceus]KAG1855178.1 hypothetical protein DFJ58DRAFT_727615 [Suillus subalutaceus]